MFERFVAKYGLSGEASQLPMTCRRSLPATSSGVGDGKCKRKRSTTLPYANAAGRVAARASRSECNVGNDRTIAQNTSHQAEATLGSRQAGSDAVSVALRTAARKAGVRNYFVELGREHMQDSITFLKGMNA